MRLASGLKVIGGVEKGDENKIEIIEGWRAGAIGDPSCKRIGIESTWFLCLSWVCESALKKCKNARGGTVVAAVIYLLGRTWALSSHRWSGQINMCKCEMRTFVWVQPAFPLKSLACPRSFYFHFPRFIFRASASFGPATKPHRHATKPRACNEPVSLLRIKRSPAAFRLFFTSFQGTFFPPTTLFARLSTRPDLYFFRSFSTLTFPPTSFFIVLWRTLFLRIFFRSSELLLFWLYLSNALCFYLIKVYTLFSIY